MTPATAQPPARSVLRLPPVTVTERVHHDSHLLLWQHLGTSDLTVNGHAQRLSGGHVALVPADVRHTLAVHAGSVVIPLLLRLGLPLERLPAGTTREVDAELAEMLLALVQHESDLLRTDRDVQALVAERLTGRHTDAGAPPLPRSGEALSVASWLVEHPEDTRPLDVLAAAAFVSQRTVERQFRTETGLTPQRWRSHNRLARAAELISSGVAPSVAAARVGYGDTDAFRRAFKTKFGMTPRGASLAAHRRDAS